MRTFDIEQAMQAQRALRTAAGLAPEMFPIEAFVGMISDEIDHLRARGMTDQEIAALIGASASIEITAAEIARNYAGPELRHRR